MNWKVGDEAIIMVGTYVGNRVIITNIETNRMRYICSMYINNMLEEGWYIHPRDLRKLTKLEKVLK